MLTSVTSNHSYFWCCTILSSSDISSDSCHLYFLLPFVIRRIRHKHRNEWALPSFYSTAVVMFKCEQKHFILQGVDLKGKKKLKWNNLAGPWVWGLQCKLRFQLSIFFVLLCSLLLNRNSFNKSQMPWKQSSNRHCSRGTCKSKRYDASLRGR